MVFLGLLCMITKRHTLWEYVITMYSSCTRSVQLLPQAQILPLDAMTVLSEGPSVNANIGSLVTGSSGAFT